MDDDLEVLVRERLAIPPEDDVGLDGLAVELGFDIVAMRAAVRSGRVEAMIDPGFAQED